MAAGPNLDQVVLDALRFHAGAQARSLAIPEDASLLVVASGNALPTGRVVFQSRDAQFANEGSYPQAWAKAQFDAVVVISASGEKHAPIIVEDALGRGADVYLMTCRGDSTAASKLRDDRVSVSKSLDEPLTYNTSTYLGMILPSTSEDASAILAHVVDEVEPLIQSFGLDRLAEFGAHYVIIPERFDLAQPMVVTKFDELFGGRINGRVYTFETTKHAKTVVPWESELFTAIGCTNGVFGSERLDLPLSTDAGYAEFIAVAYYFVGRLQSTYPDWFWQEVDAYKAFQESLFD